ncbi:ATP-binding protein [Planctomyces sp. SH-PL62]|uniref:ATP-binding protein n=1 Tax=Planctomyces sp. SH-PL62 TaxID=1636152 RepID=UPI00078CD185|nr:ATP-binding protein [Planctomyces sp. SH-PL62]AMV38292.1 hypothetical protein VT85_12700 [Planctomyces sp. SH-PL62]
MERNRHNAPQGSAPEPRPGSGPGSWDAAVASRRAALESLGSTLLDASGSAPVLLLTGEAGAGKTWVRGRLVERLPEGWRAAVVEVSPTLDAVDFLTLAAARLGAAPAADRPATLRLAVAEALEDDADEGRAWLLVVEHAQHAAPEVWAEIEALCDGLGASGGFAAVVLVGRTELARRLASRSLRAFATRLTRHAHLPPLDVEEAARLLVGVDEHEVERLHRDAAGNARRLLALAGDRSARRSAVPTTPREAPPRPSPAPRPRPRRRPWPPRPGRAARGSRRRSRRLEPAVGPARGRRGPAGGRIAARPGSLAPQPAPAPRRGRPDRGGLGRQPGSRGVRRVRDLGRAPPADGELVEDHYAALQAWSEWARNRDQLTRGAEPATDDGDDEEAEVEIESRTEPVEELAAVEADADARDENEVDAEEDEEPLMTGDLRAELRHEHAPYSQLFTKLRQSS